jgi:hypothetical protein
MDLIKHQVSFGASDLVHHHVTSPPSQRSGLEMVTQFRIEPTLVRRTLLHYFLAKYVCHYFNMCVVRKLPVIPITEVSVNFSITCVLYGEPLFMNLTTRSSDDTSQF